MKYDSRPWPGDPGAAWAAAHGAPPLERPPAPEVTATFERFLERVVFEPTTRFHGWVNLAFGVLSAGAIVVVGHFRDRVGELGAVQAYFLGGNWFHNAVALASPLFIVGGLIAVLVGPAVHARRQRRLFERARGGGIVALACATGYKVPDGEDLTPVTVALDPRVGDLQAGRLMRAAEIWLAGLRGDEKAWQKFAMRLGGYSVVRTETVFGPEAAGGFLRTDRRAGSPLRWRLILPDRKDPRAPYGHWDVFTIDVRVEAAEGI